jgi:hypothetical protein
MGRMTNGIRRVLLARDSRRCSAALIGAESFSVVSLMNPQQVLPSTKVALESRHAGAWHSLNVHCAPRSNLYEVEALISVKEKVPKEKKEAGCLSV